MEEAIAIFAGRSRLGGVSRRRGAGVEPNGRGAKQAWSKGRGIGGYSRRCRGATAGAAQSRRGGIEPP
jgi:hypothetical protein